MIGWVFAGAWAVVIAVGAAEHRRERRRRVCPECGGRRLEITGGGYGQPKRLGRYSSWVGGSWTVYRCMACGAELYQGFHRRVVTKDVWLAGGGRDDIPAAVARAKSERDLR